MIRNSPFIHRLTVLLFVLFMGTSFALPAGLHFEMCLGQDGHFEIQTDTCLFESSLDGSSLANQDHHEDCLDVAVGCTTSERLCRFTSANQIYTSILRNHLPRWEENSGREFSHPPPRPPIRSSLFPAGIDLQPHYPAVLTNVILLI